MQLAPASQLAPYTVPASIIPCVRVVPGVLVFIGTTRSTGSVDQVWPKQTEHGQHRTNAQKGIFVISTFPFVGRCFSLGK
jgi:hypothetical protein